MTLIERVEREGSVDIGICSAEVMGEYAFELAETAPHLELLWESADGETGNVTIRKATIIERKKNMSAYFTSEAIAMWYLQDRHNTPYVSPFAPKCEDGSWLLLITPPDEEDCEMWNLPLPKWGNMVVTLKAISPSLWKLEPEVSEYWLLNDDHGPECNCYFCDPNGTIRNS